MSNTLNISQQQTCRGTLVALVVLVIFGAAGGSCVQLELTDSTGARVLSRLSGQCMS